MFATYVHTYDTTYICMYVRTYFQRLLKLIVNTIFVVTTYVYSIYMNMHFCILSIMMDYGLAYVPLVV